MTDWELVTPTSADTPGKVRKVRTYTLTPGMAYVYNEGNLYSPRRTGPTRLIRLEGLHMDKVHRLMSQCDRRSKACGDRQDQCESAVSSVVSPPQARCAS